MRYWGHLLLLLTPDFLSCSIAKSASFCSQVYDHRHLLVLVEESESDSYQLVLNCVKRPSAGTEIGEDLCCASCRSWRPLRSTRGLSFGPGLTGGTAGTVGIDAKGEVAFAPISNVVQHLVKINRYLPKVIRKMIVEYYYTRPR